MPRTKSIVSWPSGGGVMGTAPPGKLQHFEVAEIIAKRDTSDGTQYLVKWKGRPAEYFTWEPVSNVATPYLVNGSNISPPVSASSSLSHDDGPVTSCDRPAWPVCVKAICHTGLLSRKKRSASSHGHNDNLNMIKRPKGSNSPISDISDREVAAHPITTRALTLEEVLNGVTGGRIMSVMKGQLADIPTPGPSLLQVVNHPDYATFMAKLAALPGPPITLRNEFDPTKPSPPLEFEFLTSLRLGKDVPVWDDSASFGCQCGPGGCEVNEQCQCLERLYIDENEDGDSYAELSYTTDGRLKLGQSNFKIIYECNDVCSCGPSCGNKVVGRGRQVPLEIFMTAENKGWGLRSPRPLRKGTFIGKYLGEVVTHEEATKRAIDGDTRGSSYLFDLDFFTVGQEDGEVENYSVDGRLCGSFTRFINHSCDPNADTYVVVSYRRDSVVYDLAMFTNRDLRAWEEITFSYTEGPPPVGPEGKKNTWPCHCGAVNCRGELW